jgi:hypothetical protein
MITIFSPQEHDQQYILHLPSNNIHWKTSLYNIDTESCILASYFPCHLYSKVISKKRHQYKYYLTLFTLMYMFYYTTIVGCFYLPSLTCEGSQVDSCTIFAKDECEKSFIVVNEYKSYQCSWSKPIELCVPTTNQEFIRDLIMKGNMNTTYTCFSIMFLVVFFANYQFRTAYQADNSIPRKSWKDCLITFFFPVCSNAQIYREYDIKPNDLIV